MTSVHIMKIDSAGNGHYVGPAKSDCCQAPMKVVSSPITPTYNHYFHACTKCERPCDAR